MAIAAVALGGCDVMLQLDPVSDLPADMECTSKFCIDRTEVTRTAYAEFLAASATDVDHPACSGHDHTPYGSWPPAPGDALPVVEVDWCDAYAYCAWAGKRLCGAIGGGPLPPSELGSIQHDEWYFACTGGHDGQAYPYGADYVRGQCNGDNVATNAHPVTDDVDCSGGLTGLLDMSGNVWEHVDACASDAPDADCDICGGAWNEGPATLTCASCTGLAHPRNSWHQGIIGFRCCKDHP